MKNEACNTSSVVQMNLQGRQPPANRRCRNPGTCNRLHHKIGASDATRTQHNSLCKIPGHLVHASTVTPVPGLAVPGWHGIGAIVPVVFHDWHSPLVLPLMLICGMIGGALYAAIPAFLKAHMNTNEILTSLMLVYIAQLFLDWLVRGPWRSPDAYNFPVTRDFAPEAILPELVSSGRANLGFAFAIIAAVALWVMMRYTLKGFEITVLGQSERAGRFAGFSSKRMIWFSMLLSGALAGLAGISEVSGTIGKLQPIISPGYGFTAIIVAFLGRLNPLGIIAAGLFLALTYVGGEAVQLTLTVSDKVTRVFQGLLLFFVLSCDTLIQYKIRLVFSRLSRGNEGGAL